jgi:histidyl-tRNA synthetase
VAVTANAPRQLDYLCDACAAHFERVQAGLQALGVPYVIETRLVRGIDYYTRTTFEFAGLALESAQNALGGGGRYDGLVAELGGPPTPGIGFALGVERILLACDAEGVFGVPAEGLDVFVVDLTDGSAARDLTFALRRGGLRADRAFDNRSAKAQFKAADRSRARLAVIVGPDELAAGKVSIKELRGEGQDTVPLPDLVDEVRRRLGR